MTDTKLVEVNWFTSGGVPEDTVKASVVLLAAVADPIRWTVLQRLSASTLCVCKLQDHLPIAPNLLSYHLKVLREAGLVTTSRRGRWIDYTLADDAVDRLRTALPGVVGLGT
jgi:ArsR family transcriptional regulator, arsenate/arsenite/antimonite-responsive transcriptional repressor